VTVLKRWLAVSVTVVVVMIVAFRPRHDAPAAEGSPTAEAGELEPEPSPDASPRSPKEVVRPLVVGGLTRPEGVPPAAVRPERRQPLSPEYREEWAHHADYETLRLERMEEIVQAVSDDLGSVPSQFSCNDLFCWVYWPTEEEPASQVGRLTSTIQGHMPPGPEGESIGISIPSLRSGNEVAALLARRPLTYDESLASIDLMADMARATWPPEMSDPDRSR